MADREADVRNLERPLNAGLTAEEFRHYGRELVDWIADYYGSVESYPVRSRVAPGEIRALLPDLAPEKPESFDSILADIDRIILPGITHWQSPNFFAYYPANTSFPSILGELLSAGLGVQGMLWSTSPACTELETHVLDWLVDLLALPEAFKSSSKGGGVIQDTASSATLCALLAARDRVLSEESGGLDASSLVAYTSREAHSSVTKAAGVAGIGRNRLRLVECDGRGRMDPAALRETIEEDADGGLRPFFVCATVGTTSSMAIDPVEQIGKLAREHRLWLHVDAAMAGSAAVCPEFRYVHAGLEAADSYCFNPHKWLLTNFDCDCFYVRDRRDLLRSFSILPEYLRNAATDTGQVIDYRDWQIPLGRRFRSLKLWFVLRSYGAEMLRDHIRRHVNMAAEFTEWVREDPDFELAVPTELNLVCFRNRCDDEANREAMDVLNASGKMFLTQTKIDDRFVLRLCIGQAGTTLAHVRRAWDLIRATFSELRTTDQR